MKKDLNLENGVALDATVDTKKISGKLKYGIAAAIAFGHSMAFATTTSTGTILGKMTTYAAGDLWGTVGSVIGIGLPVAAGAWKMSETGQLKHLGI